MSNDLSIASTPFFFLFFPLGTGLYYLIPRKNGLTLRNIFLVLISLFFYAWGEPVLVFLLLGTVFLTWLFGKAANGKRGSPAGKTAVAFTVLMNLAVIFVLGKFDRIVGTVEQIAGIMLPLHLDRFPLGFSFFAFTSISYVVDLYRGKQPMKTDFLHTALYTCSFFKIMQGPILSYRKFEEQIDGRIESFEAIGEGVWRFALGFAKKMILAGNISCLVDAVLYSEYSELSLPDAWVGCLCYLVYLYFDFSGYSDMAIGLGRIFGFTLPENFNYPYLSTSVAEFWRRFHITLCVWFTEYLYYPIVLGPSVRFRKFLLRHNVGEKTAKTLQSIVVPAAVWSVTALWHGINLNYLIWGLANCTAMLVEPFIKPIKNKKANTLVRWFGLILFLFLSVPLIGTHSFADALALYRGMFAGSLGLSASTLIYLQYYGVFLVIGIIGCFPIFPLIKKKILLSGNCKLQKTYEIVSAVLLFLVFFLSLAYLFQSGTVDFLYQK